jgi:co-chaperonin GroES (HSP10)
MTRAGSSVARAAPDANKQKLLDELGDVSDVRIPLNRILLAIYKSPEVTRGGIIRPDIVKDEDIYQGVVGLVIGLGPHCYEENDAIDWREEDQCSFGDWVMFRRGEGLRVRVNKCECILMESERGIKMVLPRPDVVF